MSGPSQQHQQQQQQQQQQPPFPNKYNSRLVAQQDAKPCTICFKPSTTVLLAENNGDFFYTCIQHLSDEQFASPVLLDDYTDLQKGVDELRLKVDKLQKEADAAKPYLWGISSYWSKEKTPTTTTTTTGKEDDNKDKNKDETKEKEKGKEKEKEKAGSNYESLKKQLLQTQQELNEKQTQLTQFKFKKYTLNTQVYRNRLMLKQKKIYNQQRTEKIQKPGFFPSAPNHEIT